MDGYLAWISTSSDLSSPELSVHGETIEHYFRAISLFGRMATNKGTHDETTNAQLPAGVDRVVHRVWPAGCSTCHRSHFNATDRLLVYGLF